MRKSQPLNPGGTIADSETLSELLVILSRCFEQPDASFVEAVNNGEFAEALTQRTAQLDIDVPPASPIEDLQTARAGYRRTFEAYDGPYAPPVESVYKEWHDGQHRELLSGPPAVAMQRTLTEAGIDVPDRYPPDHIVVLLEFVSMLLTADDLEAVRSFWETHLDWIPAFQERVEQTSDDPFYRWATTVLSRTVAAVEEELAKQTPEHNSSMIE